MLIKFIAVTGVLLGVAVFIALTSKNKEIGNRRGA